MYGYYKKENKDDNEVTFKKTGINLLSKLCLNLFPINVFNQ